MQSRLLLAAATCLSALFVSYGTHAAVITTTGAGSAVTTVDRIATFDAISGSLLGYTEDNLLVSTVGDWCCHGGRHYAGGGNTSYVTIATVDGLDFFGLELDVGAGWGNDTLVNVVWETLRDGITTGSGVVNDVSSFGSVLGWSDVALFDTLRVGAGRSVDGYNAFGMQQAISLDNVMIDATVSSVPVPAAVWLFGSGLLGLIGVARRKKAA